MNRLFAVLCVGIIVAVRLIGAESERDYFCTETAPQGWAVSANCEWMKRVPDSTKLSALSIPGTHDTCARFGGLYAQCQALTLEHQFAIGIRFLDVRCQRNNGEFAIFHGPFFQKMNFDEVQDACIAFLSAHPSECIVMNVQEESSPTGTPPAFEITFKKYISGHEKSWLVSSEVPSMSEARGKIVLVSHAVAVGGFQWKSFDMQNDWTVSTPLEIPDKWKKVKAHLEKVGTGTSEKWYLNFASASGIAAFPSLVAKEINSALYGELSKPKKRVLGTILMDFPGERLVDRIVRSNFESDEK